MCRKQKVALSFLKASSSAPRDGNPSAVGGPSAASAATTAGSGGAATAGGGTAPAAAAAAGGPFGALGDMMNNPELIRGIMNSPFMERYILYKNRLPFFHT